MRCLRARTLLLVGTLVAALAPLPAGAWGYRFPVDCGGGNEMCVAACDYHVPWGLVLGQCYDHCYRGTAICAASQIPPLGHRRLLHLRRRADP